MKASMNPTSHFNSDMAEIENKLNKEREIWLKRGVTELSEQASALQDLAKIDKQIKALKPMRRATNPRDMIQFDSEQIILAVGQLIQVRGQEEEVQ